MTRPQRIAALSLTFALFLLLAPIAVLYALGYRLYQDPLHIERTGLILLRPTTNAINAYIDSQAAEKSSSPIRFAFLRPGPHRIILTKEGMLPWKANVSVGQGEAVRISPAALFSTPSPLNAPDGLSYNCRAEDAILFTNPPPSSSQLNDILTVQKSVVIRNRQTYVIPEAVKCLSSTVIGSIKEETLDRPDPEEDAKIAVLTVYQFPPLFGDGTLRTTQLSTSDSLRSIERASSGEIVYMLGDGSIWVWSDAAVPQLFQRTEVGPWALAGGSIVRWNAESVQIQSLDGNSKQDIKWKDLVPVIPASTEAISQRSQDDGLILFGPWGHVVIREGQVVTQDAQPVTSAGYRHRPLQPMITWVRQEQNVRIRIGGDSIVLEIDTNKEILDIDPEQLIVITKQSDGIGFISLVPSIVGSETSVWPITPNQIHDIVVLETGVAALIQSRSQNEEQQSPAWSIVTRASSL